MVVDDEHWEDGMVEMSVQGFNDWVQKLLELGEDILCYGEIPFDIPWYFSAAIDIAKAMIC